MSISGIVNLLQQYATGGNAAAGQGNAQEDFEKVAQNATPNHMAQGLSQAFQSDRTPPFAEMVSGLFSQSNAQQRAGLLNRLLGAASGSGLGGVLGGQLGNLLKTGNEVTPEQAEQVSPEAVQQLAQHAHQNNPSIVDTVSNFYAQHPQVVKTLGAGALALIMGHMWEKRETG